MLPYISIYLGFRRSTRKSNFAIRCKVTQESKSIAQVLLQLFEGFLVPMELRLPHHLPNLRFNNGAIQVHGLFLEQRHSWIQIDQPFDYIPSRRLFILKEASVASIKGRK